MISTSIDMNSHPAVSICMPTYNASRFFTEAIESAIQQAYPLFEVLIVDNGSTDGTLQTAMEYAKKFPNVRVVENPVREGMVANWTKCIEVARYEWIKFLFQDDIMEKDCVQKMMAAVQINSSNVALCARDIIIDENSPQSSKDYFKNITKPEHLFAAGFLSPDRVADAVATHQMENIFGEPICLLFNKTVFKEVGGFKSELYQLVDFDFIIRCGLQYGITFLSEPLVHFRVHGQSQTSNNASASKERPGILKRIRSVYGDELILAKRFLTDSRYIAIKEKWSEEGIKLFIRYLYLKACKNYGPANVRMALEAVYAFVPEVKHIRYHYIYYKITKMRYNRFRKQRKSLY